MVYVQGFVMLVIGANRHVAGPLCHPVWYPLVSDLRFVGKGNKIHLWNFDEPLATLTLSSIFPTCFHRHTTWMYSWLSCVAPRVTIFWPAHVHLGRPEIQTNQKLSKTSLIHYSFYFYQWNGDIHLMQRFMVTAVTSHEYLARPYF